MINNNKTYWLFTITVLVALLIPTLVQQGMFLDGITYSAISNNLSNDIGNYWSPHYTKTLYPEFHEHPPMVFMIQSFFFNIFGDGYLTERIYTFFTALLTVYAMILCWRLFVNLDEMRKSSWILIFLWITIPLVMW